MRNIFTKLIIPLAASSLLCACATTVEIQDVKITELATLDSDYRFIPGKSGFEYEGEFEGQALSNVSRVKNKSFLALSFTSPDDLKHMASELRGGGLRYWIAPCDKNANPKESRYGDGVMVPSQDTSEIKRYFVFIPNQKLPRSYARSE